MECIHCHRTVRSTDLSREVCTICEGVKHDIRKYGEEQGIVRGNALTRNSLEKLIDSWASKMGGGFFGD